MITKDEHEIIHQYIILTITRKALEYDLKQINSSPLKLEQIYIELLKKVLDHLSQELAIIKRFMKQRELKITLKSNDGLFSNYSYYCRGYEGKSSCLNIHLKNQVIQYLKNNLLYS